MFHSTYFHPFFFTPTKICVTTNTPNLTVSFIVFPFAIKEFLSCIVDFVHHLISILASIIWWTAIGWTRFLKIILIQYLWCFYIDFRIKIYVFSFSELVKRTQSRLVRNGSWSVVGLLSSASVQRTGCLDWLYYKTYVSNSFHCLLNAGLPSKKMSFSKLFE